MSSTRIIYDRKITQARNKINDDIGKYPLSMDNNENNGKCYSAFDQGGTNSNSLGGDRDCTIVGRVINDSHLTRDSFSKKGIKIERNLEKQDCNLNKECESENVPRHTRLSDPIDNYRGLELFDFHKRPIPDETANNCHVDNLRIGVNTVLNAKDNFRSN